MSFNNLLSKMRERERRGESQTDRQTGAEREREL